MPKKETTKFHYRIVAKFVSKVGKDEVENNRDYIEAINLFEKALKEISVKSNRTEGRIEICARKNPGERDFDVIFER